MHNYHHGSHHNNNNKSVNNSNKETTRDVYHTYIQVQCVAARTTIVENEDDIYGNHETHDADDDDDDDDVARQIWGF